MEIDDCDIVDLEVPLEDLEEFPELKPEIQEQIKYKVRNKVLEPELLPKKIPKRKPLEKKHKAKQAKKPLQKPAENQIPSLMSLPTLPATNTARKIPETTSPLIVTSSPQTPTGANQIYIPHTVIGAYRTLDLTPLPKDPANPRCVYCLGRHYSVHCTVPKPRLTPFNLKCYNCGGEHYLEFCHKRPQQYSYF